MMTHYLSMLGVIFVMYLIHLRLEKGRKLLAGTNRKKRKE